MAKLDKDRTIEDFGRQWTRYVDNSGYYGSVDMLRDVIGPLTDVRQFRDKEVLDIGSGTGRIVSMLIEAGARRVIAIEPSRAFDTLQAKVAKHGDKVVSIRASGENLPADIAVDHAVSIGVLHHIEDPRPVTLAVYRALRSGGTFVAWLYGREGNELYLALIQPLRAITTRLPHFMLSGLCHILNLALFLYGRLSKYLRLPMQDYVREVILPLSWNKRYLVIYDQLNPKYVKYYRGEEAQYLLESAGFDDVRLYNRHGYSWTVIGYKK